MLAVKYVAAQFEEMELRPAGENGTYFQSVRFRHIETAGSPAKGNFQCALIQALGVLPLM
jgi:hypothetical protein